VKYLFAVVVFGALSSAVSLNADEPISVSVYPTVSVARGAAQLRILVERNGQNRMLTWVVDGPSYYRSSTAQLDGAEAPRSYFFIVKDLPEGDYEVRATVKRNNNSESFAHSRITVVRGTRE
jgi:hypothetical protein